MVWLNANQRQILRALWLPVYEVIPNPVYQLGNVL